MSDENWVMDPYFFLFSLLLVFVVALLGSLFLNGYFIFIYVWRFIL